LSSNQNNEIVNEISDIISEIMELIKLPKLLTPWTKQQSWWTICVDLIFVWLTRVV